MLLMAIKVVVLVVMEKKECLEKDKKLHKETCSSIRVNPTNEQKTKLIKLLKKIKVEGGIDDRM